MLDNSVNYYKILQKRRIKLRRKVYVSVILTLCLGLLVSLSCSRENTLTIVSINKDSPILSDLADFGIYRDPTDPESEPEQIEATPTDFVPIEFSYGEIGIGLPTWRPYVASINKITVTFSRVMGEAPENLPRIEIKTNIQVPSDPTGKKTVTANVPLIPSLWKEENFGSGAGGPTELGTEAILNAKIKVDGVDIATGQAITAEATTVVQVGNFWDDPTRLGE